VDVHRVLALRHGLAKVVEAAVASDPVKPGPRVDRTVIGKNGFVCSDVNLLQYVLCVLRGREHSAAESEEANAVAIDESFEGALLSVADHRDEAFVPLEFEQARASA
jgi:hypothetical protein